MSKLQFNGKNLEEALAEAAKHFAVDKAFICYNTINKPAGGLFAKIFSRGVQIEAWIEVAKEDLQEAARKAVRDALKKPSAQTTTTTKTATTRKPETNSENNLRHKKQEASTRSQLNYRKTEASQGAPLNLKDGAQKELLDKYNALFFNCFDLSTKNYSLEENEGSITVKVNDEFMENFLAKSDKLALSYEHVFKRLAQKKVGDISGRLVLEAGSSNEKREERLLQMARSLAEKVKKTGKSVILSSKSSQERKTIHMALDGYEGVGTRSVGAGDKRRLVIYSLEKRASATGERKAKGPQNKKNSPQKNSRPRGPQRKKKQPINTPTETE